MDAFIVVVHRDHYTIVGLHDAEMGESVNLDTKRDKIYLKTFNPLRKVSALTKNSP